jgi:hypothetical protein
MSQPYVIIDTTNNVVYNKWQGRFEDTLTAGALYKAVRKGRWSGLGPSYFCEAKLEALHHADFNGERTLEIQRLDIVLQNIETAKHWGNAHVAVAEGIAA